MKKKLFFMLLGVLMMLPAMARDFTYPYKGQTLTYTVIDEDAKTCMTKAGYEENDCCVAGNDVSGDLVIPSKVSDGETIYTVTSIGKYAFSDCTGIISVTIPESVTSIGSYAFYECTGLTKAEFASIEALCKIYFQNWASNPLNNAHHLYIKGEEVTEAVIPETVTSIGNYAFYECTGIISVNILENVTSIGNYAFYECTDIISVTIPKSVTSIGNYAFSDCTSLTKAEFASIEALCKIDFQNWASNPLNYAQHLYIKGEEVTEVVIPETVTSIGNYAFYGCTGLTSVSISEGVTSIGSSAFSQCNGLTSVTISESVTSIGDYTFNGCTGLTSIIVPESVTSIGEGTFGSCTELTSVTIPESVTSIGDYSFLECTGLTSITIPESVTSIGSSAFQSCTGLTSITIPESVTSIGHGAFSQCNGLTSVTIPKSVTSIGNGAFLYCIKLESVYYGADKPVSGDSDLFSEETYENATLYMTEKGVRVSSTIDPWKNFKNIEAYEFNGIEGVVADFNDNAPCEIYNLGGVKVADSLDALTPGLYIVRQGKTVKKAAVK